MGADFMLRQARLDAPGTLHHVIIRGIEKKEIVTDNTEKSKARPKKDIENLL